MFDASTISPVAFSLFGIDVYWYGLSYAVGMLVVLFYVKSLEAKFLKTSTSDVGTFFNIACLAIIIGGRLGHVLFFEPRFYLTHPGSILDFREGGMAFHGALIGVVVALWIFCRKRHKEKASAYALVYADIIATAAPLGLLLGRLANFINNELYGHPTTSWVGVIFRGSSVPRHPTQIYEAICEGGLTFALLNLMLRLSPQKVTFGKGVLFATFLISYAASRIAVDFFKEAPHYYGFTIGQWLSFFMLIFGAMILLKRRTRADWKEV
ncbi:MAG: prolipoprotein diacylglyceryl transferase [Holosporales bacterium]|jgi:phosphatidylglycerol:prolipoprotein diacylglycerol transferase|nr:prolipoprotein diacylglyceryl transferase [Holosporales bacterium]